MTFQLPLIIPMAAGPCEIREARVGDAAQFLEFLPRLEGETEFMAREPGEFRMTLEEEEQFLRERLADPRHLSLVAIVGGRLVGSLNFSGGLYRRYEHQGNFGMGVLRESWGQGIGSALLGALLGWARQRGIIRLELQVAADNERAIRLYRRFGFREEGRLAMNRRLGSGRYQDTLEMARIEIGSLG